MEGLLQFQEDDYDLDGLLRMSDTAMADFIFMIQEDESETYYIDRNEIEKYDSSFTKFVRRVKDYLEVEETRGLYVLFAKEEGEKVQLFDGNGGKPRDIKVGDIVLEEGIFYGMMIQYVEGEYVFHEAVYTSASYAGDSRVELIQSSGELTALMENFILEFK